MTLAVYNRLSYHQMTRRRWRVNTELTSAVGVIPVGAVVKVVQKRGGLAVWYTDPDTGKHLTIYQVSPFHIDEV